MANVQEVKTSYFCECTLSITDEVLPKKISETKDNFNSVPSIHEVDEDDDDCEENIIDLNDISNIKNNENLKDKQKNSFDDEFAYTNESFCSDDSCDESEESTSQYLISRSCSLVVEDNKREPNEKIENSDNLHKQMNCNKDSNESIHSEKSLKILHSNEKYMGFGKAKARRRNMTFTDDEVRKIERDNELLLRKIMAQHQSRDKNLKEGALPRMSSSAINRKKLQKKIEGDNMLLLRRIQQAKPCVIPKSTTPGYRMTFI